MPPQSEDQMTALAQRVLPLFAEYGVSCFVLVGYRESGDGKLQRVCIAQTANNPAYEDALRPIVNFAMVWGAPPQSFVPPPSDTKPEASE